MRAIRAVAILIVVPLVTVCCGSDKNGDDDVKTGGGRAGSSGDSGSSGGPQGGSAQSGSGGRAPAGASGDGGGGRVGSGGGTGGKTSAASASGGAAAGDAGSATGGAGESAGGEGAQTGGIAGSPALPPALTWSLEEATSGVGYEAIWGSGEDDIYAVGRLGTLLHFSERAWKTEPSGTSATLTGVWGSGPDDVYVSVNANVVLHSVGDGMWTRETVDAGYTFDDVWGLGADDVYALADQVFRKQDDGSWDAESDSVNGNTIWGSSPTDLYIGTNYSNAPTIYHSSGDGNWTGQSSPAATVNDLWGTASDHVFAAAGQSVFFSEGNGSWSAQLTVTGDVVTAVWAATPTAVYACTQNGMIYRSNGAGTWDEGQRINGTGPARSCFSIWGTGPDNIYVGTLNGVYRGVAAE